MSLDSLCSLSSLIVVLFVCASLSHRTAKCAASLSDLAKNKRSMRRLKSEWHEYLNKLARYVRMDLDPIERLKLCALITIEVHARDVIDRLKTASKKQIGVNSFEWTSQLRFYFDKPQGDFGKCVVRQTNTSFNYGSVN